MLALDVKWVVLALFALVTGCAAKGKYFLAGNSPSKLYVCGFDMPSAPSEPDVLQCAPMEIYLGELKKVCEPENKI